MNPYEVMFIINPDAASDEAVDAQIERFGKLVADQGGEVIAVDKWGKRRLAYEIEGLTEGYYVVMQFRADRNAVAELSRVMRISDEIVRHMVVRLEESQLKTARQAPAAQAPAESAAGEAQPAGGDAAGAPEAVEASTASSGE